MTIEMTKGDLIKKVYTKKEQSKIDVGIPKYFWDKIDTSIHVMNYNINICGELENIKSIAKKRNIKL